MSEEVESASGPSDAWHRRQGGEWREEDGHPVVASYGDPAGEFAALRTGCGLVEDRRHEVLVVRGEDRRRFLNGYLTCDVADLERGQGAYGFFTNPQGRILGDALVAAGDEVLRVEVPRGRRAPLIEHLSRYILADRVELEPDETSARWLLVGPDAEALVGAVPTELWSSAACELGGVACEARRQRPFAVPVVGLRVGVHEAPTLAEACLAAGARPAGDDALETLRITAGVPRYGADFDEAHFPQESGFDDAVSYTKGCYLGQEVVARIHYRGRVNHEVRGLRVVGGGAPELGPVTWEGEEVGTLGSLAHASELGTAIGLAILHRKALEVGAIVTLAGGSEARVEPAGFAAREAAAEDPGEAE